MWEQYEEIPWLPFQFAQKPIRIKAANWVILSISDPLTTRHSDFVHTSPYPVLMWLINHRQPFGTGTGDACW